MESTVRLITSVSRSAAPFVLFLIGLGAVIAAIRAKPSTRPGLVTVALSGVVAGLLLLVGRERGWLWLMSAIPAILVFHQGVSLLSVRGAQVPADHQANRDLLKSLRLGDSGQGYLTQIDDARRRYFSLSAVLLGYVVPAVLLLGLCITLFDATHDPDIRKWINLPQPVARAATCGFAGAYTYVLILLGHRAYQRDVTSGAAMWSAVTLALGPVLAGAIAAFWEPKSEGDLSSGGVYFLAGFAPRFVAEGAIEMIRRTWFTKSTSTSERTIPMTQVRGIDARIAERFGEEGIGDASSLATADVIRLVRSTSFHKRQIVGWVDNALLQMTFPKHWQSLEEAGIRGAMDLAALTPFDGTLDEAQKSMLAAVARAANMDEALVVRGATALSRDAQVTILVLLYNLEDAMDSQGSTDARA